MPVSCHSRQQMPEPCDIKHLGQTKEEARAYYGFKDRDEEKYEDVGDDQAEQAGSAAGA